MAAFAAMAEASIPDLCHTANRLFPKCPAQRQTARGVPPAAGAPGCSTGRSERARIHRGQGPETPAGTGHRELRQQMAAPRADATETAVQVHTERAARRDGFAAGFFGVEGRTELFEEGVKCFLAQELLQPLVKDMPLTLGQLIWYPDYYRVMIHKKKVDPLRMNTAYCFTVKE